MNKKNRPDKWSVKFGIVKSVDVSAVIYKQSRKENPYIRSAAYRAIKPKHSTLIGSNSEIY
jgi:hypothetical protein